MFAVPLVVRVRLAALKLAEDPEPTLTVAGTVRAVLSLLSVTVTPPEGTACDNVTVQALVALELRLEGVQATEETRISAVRLMAVLADDPL